MNIPENLKYTEDHEWVLLKDDTVTIGITDFAQSELGDIIFIEFPEPGDTFEHGDSFGTVEAVKTVADLFSPVSGEVISINEKLEDQPELINSNPYEEGWLVKMKITDTAILDNLMNASSYKDHLS
jgi:glycine cleavage system H protein